MSEAIKVTVTDPDTGEVLGERLLDNDYMVICAGNRYLTHTNAHANGTHVLTVKALDLHAVAVAQLDSEQEQHHDDGNEDQQTEGSVHGH